LKGGKAGPALQLGSAESSLLVSKIVSGAMPPGKKLTPDLVASIRTWIDSQKPRRAGVTEADVAPIFQMRCVTCHGKRKQEGGLDLRTLASRLAGGKSGPALVPGKPEESLLLKKIVEGAMPPPKKLFEAFVRPPNSDEVDILRAWIAAGAPPAPPRPVIEVNHSEKDRSWWAFQPPRRHPVPTVSSRASVRNPVDAFLLARLETAKRSFSPEAEKLVLLRRASLDLTGLIPSPAAAEAFLGDSAPGAYERLIDRLLESSAYGERMARMWMDIAGYADSEGIIDEDRIRPHAWRYRDALIRAFNSNKPYDRFLLEQIAGDELSDYRAIQNASQEDVDRVAATGFLRMTPDGTYSPANGSVAERMNVIADEIEVLGSGVMGLTVGCARCHNHKYDPIPQLDYYRLSAVLQTALDPYDWVKPTERDLDVALPAEREEAEKHNAPIEAEISRLEALIQDSAHKADAEKHKKTVADLKKKLRTKPRVRATYDMGGDPSPVYLLRRGEAHQLGDPVDPGVPSILKFASLKPYSIEPAFHGTSGRRLALARWLVQPAHPLTARVFVNRLWKHHFGRGIVATVSNFGRTGSLPTHPELLDWLATEFVRSGWDVKAMHRLMMISTAYRQSSFAGDSSSDPDNLLLARMPVRRMDAEQLHDSVLLAVGRLSPTRFGAPVPVEVKPGGEVVEQASKDEWRRSIYLLQRRTTPVTLLEVFDLPAMSPNCNERAHSTVPTQALELRNSPVVIEHARYLAARLMDEFLQPRDRVRAAYSRVLSRLPSEAETSKALASLDTLAAHWRSHLNDQKSTAPYGSTAQWYATGDLVHALLNSAEFIYVD
jgi:mono/diheme cytochrome c family protein